MSRRTFLLLGCAACCAGFAFAKNPAAGSIPRRFALPTALDSLLDANPVAPPAIQPAPDIQADPVLSAATRDTTAPARPAAAFQIQLDAISDIDSAQARKGVLEKILGNKVEMVFDPPFYKLRFGNFSTKQAAEDALTDLAGKNLQGFVVRH